MADSREARTSASELKFIVDTDRGGRIREWARTHLAPDPYGTGPDADEYHTSSLYFDTGSLDVFHRRGSYGRAKYRVRRYAISDYVFLERKLRRPRMVVKRRTRAELGILAAHESEEVRSGPGRWFFDRLAARRLEPSCVITYDRTARGTVAETSHLRLTLDENIRVVPAEGFALPGGPGNAAFADRLILELKFRGPLPAVFRRLVETFALEPKAVSKYRLGMTTLGHQTDILLPSGDEAGLLRD